MGTMVGHVGPGLGFFAIGLWHLIKHIKLYLQSPTSYESVPWFPSSFTRYLELYLIMAGSCSSIAMELFIGPANHQPFDPSDWSIPSYHLHNFEHASISLTFLLGPCTQPTERRGMGRSPCCEKAHTNKGAWTKEEDERLIAHIRKHGDGCWRSLPKEAGLLRCGKSCRLRWINYLRPDLKRGNFTEDEDNHIIKLHSILGNKWSLIAGRLPGRTDNEIKNYWNTHIRRKLIKRGVDPQTHKPIQDHVSTGAKEDVSSLALEQQEKSSSESSSLSQTQPPLRPLFDEHRCPDLNLDLNLGLSISPPTLSFEQQRRRRPAMKEETESNGRCFYCKLGLPQGKECRCNKSIAGMMLHYRSL